MSADPARHQRRELEIRRRADPGPGDWKVRRNRRRVHHSDAHRTRASVVHWSECQPVVTKFLTHSHATEWRDVQPLHREKERPSEASGPVSYESTQPGERRATSAHPI